MVWHIWPQHVQLATEESWSQHQRTTPAEAELKEMNRANIYDYIYNINILYNVHLYICMYVCMLG